MTGATVRPAGAEDIEPVSALLHEWMNARIPVEQWRLLMDYPWRPADAERGWLVEDCGRIVGFMGTIYSDRQTRLGVRRFCDLSSWYLLADYRGDGTGDTLLRSGMAKPGVTYQTMTARRATGRKIRALGFSVLDSTRSLFRPSGAANPLSRIYDPAEISERLNDEERVMLDLHRGFDIHHAIVGTDDTIDREGGNAVWLVWQRKLKGEGIAYHEILHASDYDFLSGHAAAIAETICIGEKAVLAIDSRWMNPSDDAGQIETIPLPRWYRSPDLGPKDVGHLYSEVILLDQKLP